MVSPSSVGHVGGRQSKAQNFCWWLLWLAFSRKNFTLQRMMWQAQALLQPEFTAKRRAAQLVLARHFTLDNTTH